MRREKGKWEKISNKMKFPNSGYFLVTSFTKTISMASLTAYGEKNFICKFLPTLCHLLVCHSFDIYILNVKNEFCYIFPLKMYSFLLCDEKCATFYQQNFEPLQRILFEILRMFITFRGYVTIEAKKKLQ